MNPRKPTYRVDTDVPMRNRETRAHEQAEVTAERLNALLMQRGVSVYQFAGHIDTNAQTVYRWLRGDVSPRAELLVAICEAYGVSADWLLGLSDSMGAAPRRRTRDGD